MARDWGDDFDAQVSPTRGTGSTSSGSRRENPIIGGFAVRPPTPTGPGSLGMSGPGTFPSSIRPFDPYRDRDQRRILSRIVNQGGISDLQLALVQAGLMDSDDVAFGYLDSDTQDAFGHVLAIANQHGLDWRDALSQLGAAGGAGGQYGGGGGGGGGGGLAPTVVQLPNRDDMVAAQRETFMALTGDLTDVDQDLIEAAADSALDTLRTHQERQVQREMGAGEGLLFTEGAPDPARLLEEQVRERRPDLVAAKGARDLADLWFSMLGGPA